MMLEFVNFDFRLFEDETQVNSLSDFLTHVDETNDCNGNGITPPPYGAGSN